MREFAISVLGALTGIWLTEVLKIGAWLTPRMVRRAASKMPTPDLRKRYEEEWMAEISAFAGLNLVMIYRALAIWYSSHSSVAYARGNGTITLFHLLKVTCNVIGQSWTTEAKDHNAMGILLGMKATVRLSAALGTSPAQAHYSMHYPHPDQQVTEFNFPAGIGLAYRLFGRPMFRLAYLTLLLVITVRSTPRGCWAKRIRKNWVMPRKLVAQFAQSGVVSISQTSYPDILLDRLKQGRGEL